MAKKLFVGGISWGTNDAALAEFFSQAGNVVSASIIMDRQTGKSKGFGFVEMETEEEAKNAIDKLNGQTLDGRSLSVSEALPPKPRENNFSRGGGGYGRRDDRGGNRGFGGRDDRRGGRDDRRGGGRW